MLHNANFLANCLTTLEKETHCKLQKTFYTLQSRDGTYNGFKTICAIVAEIRTKLYFVQSLQAQERMRDNL